MSTLKYQRIVVGYHGCDESVIRHVLLRGKVLNASHNEYDWLGRGIYFWEHGPRRALEWARLSKTVKKPAVLGAFINLGNCFDLLDTAHTGILKALFPLYVQTCQATNTPIPSNVAGKGETKGDLIVRKLDRAVVDWCLDLLEKEEKQHYHTVRCLFSEGEPVFPGSKIREKTHVQVAVRDHSAIVGYFKPNIDISTGGALL